MKTSEKHKLSTPQLSRESRYRRDDEGEETAKKFIIKTLNKFNKNMLLLHNFFTAENFNFLSNFQGNEE